MDLNFSIENQILTRCDENILVNKSREYLISHFQFTSSEWDSIEKFAIFKSENNEAFNVYLGTACECECIIPSEVLLGSYFKVSVYGGNLITTSEKTVVLIPSGYTTDVSSPEGLGEDVFSQIFKLLNTKIDDIVFDDGLLKVYSNDELVKVVDTAHEDLIQGVMQTFHTELEDILEDYVRFDGISFSEGVLEFK